MSTVRILPSPDALLTDYRALVDTYAVDVSMTGFGRSGAGPGMMSPRNRTFLRVPLYMLNSWIALRDPETVEIRKQFFEIPPPMFHHATIKLIDAGQRHEEEGDEPTRRRWPFTVERQLIVDIEITSGLFWSATFEPGKEYQEIECRSNV
jgi:hypothetical protein